MHFTKIAEILHGAIKAIYVNTLSVARVGRRVQLLA